MNMLIYLACPIDQAKDAPRGWLLRERRQIAEDLREAGHDVYRPFSAFLGGACGPEIQQVNQTALDAAAGVVALLPAGVPTLGTPVEIDQALRAGKPVLIVTDLTSSAQVNHWAALGECVVVNADRSDAVNQGLVWLQRKVVESASGGLRQRGGAAFAFAALRYADELVNPWTGSLVFEEVDNEGTVLRQGERIPTSLLPSRGYEGDAGLDLYVSADTEILPYQFADVPCGVRVDIPAGMWGLITGRSSTLRRRGLLVSNGVIDCGWTGPLFAGVQNLRGETEVIDAGDRIAQLILLPAPAAGLVPVWGKVPAKTRGESGFGSTGA
jgi:dUTP pyrophosphatase